MVATGRAQTAALKLGLSSVALKSRISAFCIKWKRNSPTLTCEYLIKFNFWRDRNGGITCNQDVFGL